MLHDGVEYYAEVSHFGVFGEFVVDVEACYSLEEELEGAEYVGGDGCGGEFYVVHEVEDVGFVDLDGGVLAYVYVALGGQVLYGAVAEHLELEDVAGELGGAVG